MAIDRYSSIFVTGGAGFIGTTLMPELLRLGDRVTVFDNLLEQVHGPDARVPDHGATYHFIRGDVRDQAALADAIASTQPDLVLHLAAETGTGQSYDEVSRYTGVNVQGTAYLAEALRALPKARRRVVLASSRAVYGEGAYRDADGRVVVPKPRDPAEMTAGRFLPTGDGGAALDPIPTPEDAPPAPGSVYASTKLMQEYLLDQALTDSGIELAVLRFQNVYGAGQSLRNPYTGVLSIFGGMILRGQHLNIYEDGLITRDFVHVRDVAAAVIAAATIDTVTSEPVNIGSGDATTILDASRALMRNLGQDETALSISGDFRIGDIRHARADISRAADRLGWHPRISFEEGVAELAAWIKATS